MLVTPRIWKNNFHPNKPIQDSVTFTYLFQSKLHLYQINNTNNMSSIINKVKDKLHSDKENPNSASHGSHNSDAMNKADPRFDSDRDGRGTYTTGTTGTTTGHTTSTSGLGSTTHTGAHGSTNAGPHNSNMMNKMDPRVDSDMDNRNDPTSRTGGYGTQENYGVSGANPTPSSGGQYGTTGHSGLGSTGHTTGTTGTSGIGSTGAHHSTNAGPHNSNIMNKVDPRVDSDMDNRNDPTSRTGGYGTQENYGAKGANPMPGSSGHHTTGHTTTGTGYAGDSSYSSSATPGSGNAASTAGPHNSNLLNKLDPRVDSNLDGSKTVGGDKTHY